MDTNTLMALGFEFDSNEDINIQTVIGCLEDKEDDPLFDDAALYCYEDHFEDPE